MQGAALGKPGEVMRIVLPETAMGAPAFAVLESRRPIEQLFAARTRQASNAP